MGDVVKPQIWWYKEVVLRSSAGIRIVKKTVKTKVCSKCNKKKRVSGFNTYKGRKKEDGTQTIFLRKYCKKCQYIMTKNWYDKNPMYKKEYRKKYPERAKMENLKRKDKNRLWRLQNKDHVRRNANERRRIRKLIDPEGYRKGDKAYSRRSVILLSDTYVCSKITRDSTLKIADIKKYPALIEAKREQIRSVRLCKSLQKNKTKPQRIQ